MGFERPTPKASSEEENDLDLSPEELAFMKKAQITPAQFLQFKRWEKLAKEMGVDLAA